MTLPLPNTTAVQIVRLTKALYNAAPGNTFLTAFEESAGTTTAGMTTFANYLAGTVSTSAATLATTVVTNIGLTGDAATAGTAYLTAAFAADPSNLGRVILDAMNALATLTSDATYGTAASTFNDSIATSYAYSINTANTSTNIVTLQAADEPAATGTGQSFTLTTGTDTLTGTSGNDTFIGSDATLGAADTVVGGAGTDTMNYTNSAAATGLPAASMSGVEVLNVRAVTNGVTAGDLSLYGGLTTFNSDRSNAAITVTNLASGGTFGIIGDGSVSNAAAANFGSVAAATAQTLNISGGTLGTSAIALTGGGVLATTINSTGAANVVGTVTAAASSTSLAINATTDLTTGAVTAAGVVGTGLTISGAGAVTTNLNAVAATKLTISNTAAVATGVLNNATVTVDASTATGAVTTTLGTSTAMVFTGGTGNDIVTAGAVLGAGAAVNAAAGTDRIVFTANGQLTLASGAKYTNFEVLQSTGATDIDMDNIAGITALRTSGAATFTNVNATQAAAITTIASGALNFGVKGASTVGQLDTVSITTSSTNAAVAIATLAVADVETINLTASTGTGLTSITTLAHDDWATLNLMGSSAITVTTTATAAVINTAINGSTATGILTVDATLSTTNGLAITGGSAADSLTGSAQADVIVGGAGADTLLGLAGADTISGGDGNDTITAGAGVDSVTGGAGADKFVVSTADIDTTAGAVTDTIVDFVSGTDTINHTVMGAGSATVYGEAVAAVADLATLLTAAGTALDGTLKIYVGQVGSDSYVVTDEDGTGYTDVIKLTGVALTAVAQADFV